MRMVVNIIIIHGIGNHTCTAATCTPIMIAILVAAAHVVECLLFDLDLKSGPKLHQTCQGSSQAIVGHQIVGIKRQRLATGGTMDILIVMKLLLLSKTDQTHRMTTQARHHGSARSRSGGSNAIVDDRRKDFSTHGTSVKVQ